MQYVLYFPLLALPLIAYNVLMVSGDTLANDPALFSIPVVSGNAMNVHVSEFLVMGAVILIYFELLKAARFSRGTIVDHALSLGVFIIFLIEFIVAPGAGTPTFLTLTLISLLDIVGGFTITISTARRDIGIGPGAFGE